MINIYDLDLDNVLLKNHVKVFEFMIWHTELNKAQSIIFDKVHGHDKENMTEPNIYVCFILINSNIFNTFIILINKSLI